MGLSIKNREAERLARAVAAESGESITQAIIHALEAELTRLRGRRRQPDIYEAIMEISERCGELPDLDERGADEILGYDEHGVPG